MLGVMVSLKSQTDLLEIVDALVSVGCFPDFLNSGEKDPNQNGNDGDHHQKLN